MVVLFSPRQGLSSAATVTTEHPFSGTALLSPIGEGSRKGDPKNACLTQPCQHTAADWVSNSAVEESLKVTSDLVYCEPQCIFEHGM